MDHNNHYSLTFINSTRGILDVEFDYDIQSCHGSVILIVAFGVSAIMKKDCILKKNINPLGNEAA